MARMRSLWWILALVFLLGIGAGSRLSVPEISQGSDLPQFTATSPEESTQPSQAPTVLPMDKQEGKTLPCSLKYTALVAQSLVNYEGPYWEDGTGEDVFGVAALLLENTGTIGIEYARVSVWQGSRELSFDATFIPPRSTVLILEENRQSYTSDPVTDCRCKTVVPGHFDMQKRNVALEPAGLAGLQVTNISEESIDCLWIYYKHYEPDSDLCMGGLTYSITVRDLAPGQTVTLYPYRYAGRGSQVVAVVPR